MAYGANGIRRKKEKKKRKEKKKAKGRVSTEIAALIHNHQTLHNCNSWDTLKELLNRHFNKEVNFDIAWH